LVITPSPVVVPSLLVAYARAFGFTPVGDQRTASTGVGLSK